MCFTFVRRGVGVLLSLTAIAHPLHAASQKARCEALLGGSVERFYGVSDAPARSLRTSLDIADDSGQVAVGSLGVTVTRPRLTSRIRSNDEFALNVMVSRGILNRKQATFYGKATDAILSDQVTNIEVVARVSAKKATAMMRKLSRESKLSPRVLNAGYETSIDLKTGTVNRNTLVRRSTARLISGQVLIGGQVSDLSLPWALEFKQTLDRSHYKYIWELGRGAQIDPGLIETNVSLATVVAARELQAIGANMTDAYLFIHAPTLANAKIYRRWGFVDLKGAGNPEKNHFVLVSPLETQLKRLPMGPVFPELARIASSTGLGDLETTALVDELVDLRKTNFTAFHFGRDRYAQFTIRDFTDNLRTGTEAALVRRTGRAALAPLEFDALNEHVRDVLRRDFQACNSADGLTDLLWLKDRNTDEEIRYVQVDMQEEAKTVQNVDDAGKLLLAIYAAYKGNVSKLGNDADDVISRTDFVLSSKRPSRLSELFQRVGATNESPEGGHSAMDGVLVPGSELVRLARANERFLSQLEIVDSTDRQGRIFYTPLNF